MKNKLRIIIFGFIFSFFIAVFIGDTIINPNIAYANNDTKIAEAKAFILNFVSHPNTVRFHENSIEVHDDVVTITITYTNGIGVTQDMTMNIKTHE